MPAAFDIVTIDTPDPDVLAAFWADVLGLRVVEREDEGRWVAIGTDPHARVMGFQRGVQRVGGTHVDLACAPDELDAELGRLRACGAHQLGPARTEPYGRIVNLADPDGNPFDLCAYG